jgi:SAM-dependent methyltransferase
MPPSLKEQPVELVAVPQLHIGQELDQHEQTIQLRLIPSTDIERKDGFWLSTGPDPQLHFASAESGVNLALASGLYLLRFRATLLGPQEAPHLYARAQYDFREAHALRLRRGQDDSFAVLLNAPHGLNGLRLDPAEGVSSAANIFAASLLRLSAPLPTLHPVRTTARFPDVLCIGAQKSATTWLYQNLQHAPGIWRCPVKEFHHFDSMGQLPAFEAIRQSMALQLLNQTSDTLRMFGLALGFPSRPGWGNYLDLFAAAKPDERVIDVTPAYATLDEMQVREIARVMPHVKVLFILRDPVERSLTGAFHEARVRRLPTDLDTLRSLVHEKANEARSNYIATLDRWSRHLPPASIKIMFFDDLLWDPVSFLAEACAFIGVSPPTTGATPSIPVNVGDATQDSPSLSGLKAELSARYLPQLEVLAGRYGSPCTQWKAAAIARLRSQLATREGAGAGEAACAPHTSLNNLAQWNDIHPWHDDGDEWRGQAVACDLDYAQWKKKIVARYRPLLESEGTILEIGPGRGRFSVLLAELAPHLILADIAPNCLDACRRRLAGRVGLRTHVSSGTDLPSDLSCGVDAVWSFDCFVHLDQTIAFAYLAEIWRVLRPGGHAVIHHGDADAPVRRREAGALAEGWRSPLTASAIAEQARKIGFTIVTQEQEWLDPCRVGVPRFGDVISVLHRPSIV